MDSFSSQKAITSDYEVNHASANTHVARPSTSTSCSSSTMASPVLLRISNPIASAIEEAQPHGDGVEIVLHSNIVTGKDLKRALDDMFPGPQEYSVQLRRDRYRITLPKLNKEDVKRKMSR